MADSRNSFAPIHVLERYMAGVSVDVLLIHPIDSWGNGRGMPSVRGIIAATSPQGLFLKRKDDELFIPFGNVRAINPLTEWDWSAHQAQEAAG